MENSDKKTDLETFLTKHSLQDFLPRFIDQQIDYDVLTILTEADLKSLCLPVGPFRRLMVAITSLKKNGKSMDTQEVPPAPVISGKTPSESSSIDDIINQIPDITNIASGSNDTFHVIDESGDEDDPTSRHNNESEMSKLHPYLYDLQSFKHDFSTWDFKPSDLVEFDKKQFQLVETVEGLRDMARILRSERVIGIDLHTNEAKYKAYVVFMAVSTMTHDFIVDFKAMKSETTVLELQDVFVNPEIVKVFRNGNQRCKTLTAHFQTYCVNVVSIQTLWNESEAKAAASDSKGSNMVHLIKKYTSYQKPNVMARPFTEAALTNLRKHSHYVLYEFLSRVPKILNDKSLQDKIINANKSACGLMVQPYEHRTVDLFFKDFNKFNQFQKAAAIELYKWRESSAENLNISVTGIVSPSNFRNICLCLPITKDALHVLSHQPHVKACAQYIIEICQKQRLLYEKAPRDPEKYALFDLPTRSAKKRTFEPFKKSNAKKKYVPPAAHNPNMRWQNPARSQEGPIGHPTGQYQSQQNVPPQAVPMYNPAAIWNQPGPNRFMNNSPGFGGPSGNRSGQNRGQNQGQNSGTRNKSFPNNPPSNDYRFDFY